MLSTLKLMGALEGLFLVTVTIAVQEVAMAH